MKLPGIKVIRLVRVQINHREVKSASASTKAGGVLGLMVWLTNVN